MPCGDYVIGVHNYTQRSNSGKGFTIEFEVLGNLIEVTYPTQLQGKRMIECIKFSYNGATIDNIEVHHDLNSNDVSKEVWGISTNEYHRVTMVNYSPNHWESKQGNKHYMFMLDGCLNPNKVRGIYNEFLRSDLTPHRKVFEVLGTRSLCEFSKTQLAGVGFSSTKRDSVDVLVDNRPYTIKF